jgi:ABC-type multidrug transport system ATPase subunit
VRRQEKTILDDVSVEFPAGQLSVVLGPSGAGKVNTVSASADLVTDHLDHIATGHRRPHARTRTTDGLSPDRGHTIRQLPCGQSLAVLCRFR